MAKYERKLSDIKDWKDYGFTTFMDAKNPYRIIGDTTYILVNTGYVAQVYTVDFYNLRLYSYLWSSSSTNPRAEYIKTNYYIYTEDGNIKYVKLNLHQLILGKVDPKLYVVDHIDGDHYNNKCSNLHHVTKAENARNRHAELPRPMRYDDLFFSLAI